MNVQPFKSQIPGYVDLEEAERVQAPDEAAAGEANPTPNEAAIERHVAELSCLTDIKYALARASVARDLGLPVGILDRLVKEARRAATGVADNNSVVFPEADPWDAEIIPAVLLDEIRETILRFIVCEPEAAVAVALWIFFTWVIDRVDVAPLLVITAPEKRCGKSQLISLVGHLSFRPLPASNISSAAVFRVVEAHSPTLLLDEADTFMNENEELRGVINSGHTRESAFVIRTVGDDHEPKRFSTWGAKAIAGIGRLPETTRDRAVVVELKRKLPSEKTDRLRHADRGQFERHRRMLARFAKDNGAAIEAARPDLPEALNDRAQDNWEPLLAIADRAGGRWPAAARSAALKLSGAAHEATSSSAELLSDIRAVFDAMADEKISTAELLRGLIGKEESPWATYHAGKPMTARNLAKRLGEYSIKSTNVRFGHEVQKGFHRSQFADAFARYLPRAASEKDATALQSPESQGNAGVSERSGTWSQSATDGNFPLPLQDERRSGTANVAACSGFQNQDATRKSPENNECSGVAEFGGGAGDELGWNRSTAEDRQDDGGIDI
jgi:putative DNA primase/helicase